jgi:predicted nucleotidyltransferase
MSTTDNAGGWLDGRTLEPQHARLIERARVRLMADTEVVALVVGGSVAHGCARSDSDVDVMAVLHDDAFASKTELMLYDADLADYDGGYLDTKLVTKGFVAEVAERGSEPARWAFKDAMVAFSHDPELPALVASAAAYPNEGHDERLRTFISYLLIHVWFMGEADKRADRYLATYASSRVTLFAGRAILAHNRMLYPFHKWFLRELEQAPEKPAGLLELMDRALVEPTRSNAEALTDAVVGFCGVDVTIHEGANRFLELTEWAWRNGRAAPEDL